MKPQIIIIAGRSGSGKTTLAKTLANILGFDELGFSYVGKILSAVEHGSNEFKQIEEYVYSCIINALRRTESIIIDGLASKTIYDRLVYEGYTITTIYLDTPKRDRIDRISKREGCSIQEAELIESIKAKGKSATGLEYVISSANASIDGRLNEQLVLKETLQVYQQIIESDDNAGLTN